MDIIRVLELVHNLASGNCLDLEIEPFEDGDELEQEAYQQRQAIDRFELFIEEFKSSQVRYKMPREDAIDIAMGTFMYEWDGDVIEVYNRLQNEEADSFMDIDYATPWQPFEDFTITDLFNNMSNLVDEIVNKFS